MALLFMDGFDHYLTADIGKKWPSTSATILATSGRRGGGCAHSAAQYLTKVFGFGASKLIGGMAYMREDNIPAAIMKFTDNATDQMYVSVDSNFNLNLYRNGTLVAGPSALTLAITTWYYIEFKVTFHATAGAYELRVNGTTIFSASGVNTIGSANASADRIIVGNGTWNGRIDDFYVCDGTTSLNNDFLGDCRVDVMTPTSDGTYKQFTPSTGTNHYATVNASTAQSTTYNSDSNAGDKDSYGLTSLPPITSATVYGVQVNALALKSDSGARSIATMVRSGSTDAVGAAVGLGTSQLYTSQVQQTDPNTSAAWTQTAVNAMQAGVQVS